jgi:hypothetical protein
MASSKQIEPLRQSFSIPRGFAVTDPERQREVIGFGRRHEVDARFEMARDASRAAAHARLPRGSGGSQG